MKKKFTETLQSVDGAIQLPNLDENALIPTLRLLETDLDVAGIPEPDSVFLNILYSVIPDPLAAKRLAAAEAEKLAPNDLARQREIAAEIESTDVIKSWGLGFIVALAPFLALSLPNAILARGKRKKAAAENIKYKEVLKQDARKLAGYINKMLKEQPSSQSFPKIEPYMVHRVLTELAAKMDTEDLGFDGKDKNTAVKDWLYSLINSISDDVDTRSR